jgi:hypothetical protein
VARGYTTVNDAGGKQEGTEAGLPTEQVWHGPAHGGRAVADITKARLHQVGRGGAAGAGGDRRGPDLLGRSGELSIAARGRPRRVSPRGVADQVGAPRGAVAP